MDNQELPVPSADTTDNTDEINEYLNGIEKKTEEPSPAEKESPQLRRRMPKTLSRAEVPLLFQEPHVEEGFRQLHQPWHYYFLSIVMQLHNESMNVWTHLLACGLHFIKLHEVNAKVDFVNDPWTWPLLAGMVCGLILYACSAAAHCLQAKSELIHYTSFMFDYSGIGIYGLGSTILHLAYCSDDAFYQYVEQWFIPVGCTLSFLITFCCTVSKVIYCRPYPPIKKVWQIGPVLFIYILLISPVWHRVYICWINDVECTESIPFHLRQMAWFLISGAFFSIDLPQRWLPGKCDYFFHSHQIFHIAIMICTLYQMDAVYLDFSQRRAELEASRPIPTLMSAFGPVVIVIILMIGTIYTFHSLVKHKLHGGQGVHFLAGVIPISSYSTMSHDTSTASFFQEEKEEDTANVSSNNIGSILEDTAASNNGHAVTFTIAGDDDEDDEEKKKTQ